nr:hypothetical protein [Tanacetum cinerariifolium]
KEDIENEPGLPEYADWYALRAPEGRAIEAVAGNLDSTLVISTSFAIYQTKDRGKTWLLSDYTDRSRGAGGPGAAAARRAPPPQWCRARARGAAGLGPKTGEARPGPGRSGCQLLEK